jgi:hypothetical protein
MEPVIIAVLVCLLIVGIVFIFSLKAGFIRLMTTASAVSKDVKDLIQPVSNGGGEVLSAIADRIRASSVELEALRSKSARLAQDVEHLKARRVEVTQVQNILQLALLQAEMQIINVRKVTSKEWDERNALSMGLTKSTYMTEYLGILDVTYKQKLGVDIARLRFTRLNDAEIGVVGLGVTAMVGVNDLRMKNIVSELRTFVDGKLKSIDDEKYAGQKQDESVMHRDLVLETINGSETTRNLDKAVERLALAFLQAYLQPTGYRLTPLENEPVGAVGLHEICAQINSEYDRKISAIDDQITVVDRESQDTMQRLLDEAQNSASQRLTYNKQD